MDGAMALYPGHRTKGYGTDGDVEMALAAAIIPCMPGMEVTFIDNIQDLRRKGSTEPCFNFTGYTHNVVNPLQSFGQ